MEILLTSRFSWFSFGFIALLLILTYSGIQFLLSLFKKTDSVNRYRKLLISGIQDFILLYEPIALLVLLSVFVFIDPPLHGLLFLAGLLFSFQYIKDYLCGRILRFEHNFEHSMRLQTPNVKGVLSNIGRLGLSLKTDRGLQFINYSELYKFGFTALHSKGVGGMYELTLSPLEGRDTKSLTSLKQLLTNTPYIDSSPKPELSEQGQAGHYELRVQVREETHLNDFIQLLKEWGFHGVKK